MRILCRQLEKKVGQRKDFSFSLSFFFLSFLCITFFSFFLFSFSFCAIFPIGMCIISIKMHRGNLEHNVEFITFASVVFSEI